MIRIKYYFIILFITKWGFQLKFQIILQRGPLYSRSNSSPPCGGPDCATIIYYLIIPKIRTDSATSAIKSYKQINSDLKSLAAVSVYTEDVAKKSHQICKEIVDALAHYDGVQLDLRQSEVSVDKSLVVHFFKVSFGQHRVRTLVNRIAATLNMYINYKRDRCAVCLTRRT